MGVAKKMAKAVLPEAWYALAAKLKMSASRALFPEKPALSDEWAVEAYSQEGEDMILRRIFGDRDDGFYVDVGAHHPKRFSNTYYFYKKGWSGINIDAVPGAMAQFNRERPRDINIEAAIAKDKSERTFFIFNEPALNSFDEELSRSRICDLQYIVEERNVVTRTLEEVLAESLPEGRKIDFLSIDVEGLDLEVLQSNNWQLFRPEYVLVECFGQGLQEVIAGEIYKLLRGQGYEIFAKTVNTVVFIDESAKHPRP